MQLRPVKNIYQNKMQNVQKDEQLPMGYYILKNVFSFWSSPIKFAEDFVWK